MKKFLKWTGIVVGALALVFVAGGLLMSPHWEVSRSRVLAATPAEIHAHVSDLQKWPAWSPFEKEDPKMQISIDTPNASGAGAKRSWRSETMGNGSQTIVESDAARGMVYDLAFEGFEHPVRGQFTYEPGPGGTKVTWSGRGDMDGSLCGPWMARIMGPMLGSSFDEGLAGLETAVTSAKQ